MNPNPQDNRNRRQEDALKYALNCEEQGRAMSEEGLAGKLACARAQSLEAILKLCKGGYMESGAEGWCLSESGRQEARRIVRAHRIYETYLAERTGMRAEEWHARAEHMEHVLSEQEVNEMAQELGYPRFDPHGNPIPTRKGEFQVREGLGLHELREGDCAIILHVEDEPPVIFEELTALGLAPGMEMKVKQRQLYYLEVKVEGRLIEVDLGASSKVMVRRLNPEEYHQGRIRLSQLEPGCGGRIVKLSPACRGATRRRLLDMGMVPGTRIETELKGAFAFPRGYRLRGTLVALREEQAEKIIIEAEAPAEHV